MSLLGDGASGSTSGLQALMHVNGVNDFTVFSEASL
jgi:hypothetical protein